MKASHKNSAVGALNKKVVFAGSSLPVKSVANMFLEGGSRVDTNSEIDLRMQKDQLIDAFSLAQSLECFSDWIFGKPFLKWLTLPQVIIVDMCNTVFLAMLRKLYY